MANKIAKLTMLTVLFSTAFLGLGLTSVSEINTTSTPTKTAVSYASEDDLNDHDTNHSSEYSWTSFNNSNASTGGTLTGGSDESEMVYYYLEDNVTFSSTNLTISGYVTFCLNGKNITGVSSSGAVISVTDNAYFNLCDCSGDDSGTIKGGSNTSGNGGGVYAANAAFNMYGGTISNNEAYHGGGLYLNGSLFTMYGGIISNNKATDSGGVVVNSSTFTMHGGTISNNEAVYGAGVYVSYGTFNKHGGTISNNEASNDGGGVYVGNYSTFYMYDGTISDNEATNGAGVFVISNTGAFNMYDGTITGNTSSNDGGGVYVQSNGFTMYDGSISSNSAGNEGGGVYTSNNVTFDIYGGTITDNGIYVNSYTTFNVYGGYINSITAIWGGPIIKGGYFSETAYSSIENYIDSDYIGVDISLIGADLDDNYVEGFNHAVYTTSTSTYSIEDVTGETYGMIYEPTIRGGNVTGFAYTWIDGDDTIVGLPTDLGEYTVTAHILYTTTEEYKTTNYYATKDFKVTISNKGQAVITAVPTQSKTYDGEVASVDYEVYTGNTDITSDAIVTWYDDGVPISAPTDVGTYTAKISVSGDENYEGTSTDITYTITKGEAVINADTTQSKTYDGEVASVDYEVYAGNTDITSDAIVTWYDDGVPISTPTDVGTYTAKISVSGDENYEGTSTDITYTITKGEAVINADTTQSKTYDGTAASVDYIVYDAAGTDITSDAIVTWYDDGVPISAPTDVGTYKVTIAVTGDENYEGTSVEVSYTITKGQAEITAEPTQTKTYDGTAASPNYTVTFLDMDITADATVIETWYDEDDKPLSSAPTDVGTYRVTLTVADDTNYEGTSIDVTYTITENISSSTPSDEEDESGESGETGDTVDTGTSNDDGDTGSTTTPDDDGDTGSTTTPDDSSDTGSTTTSDDDDGDNSTSSNSTGLSAGAIAGISIASVFVVGLIAFLVYCFVFRKKKATSK